MNIKAILCVAALAMSLVAGAQNLKPAKDKVTKKYGYQDNDKNWVIPPAYDDAKRFDDFGCGMVKVNKLWGLVNRKGEWLLEPVYDDIDKFDKNGLCELTVKEGKTKYYGVANRFGTVVLAPEYDNVKINKNGLYIAASSVKEEDDALWGIYTTDGEPIFTPQFKSAPSFYDGLLVAKDGKSGLEGIVNLEARVLLPFDYLAISHFSNGFETLRKDFRLTRYNSSIQPMESFVMPGAVQPYDPMSDPVRAAAWHCGPVGRRLWVNQVLLVESMSTTGSRSARCSRLAIDWGRGRFLRLEPFFADLDDPDAMEDPYTHERYTLKALLYEADGTLVKEVSEKGWLEGECHAGALYSAGGQETWLILTDPNTPLAPSYSLGLGDFRAFNHSNVVDGLGIRTSELLHMASSKQFSRRYINIMEGENVGITSYTPMPIDVVHAREQSRVTRGGIFYHTFHMGDVVSCFVRTREDGVEVELQDQLVCRFSDYIKDPSFSMSGEETIYWGPNGKRTVKITLEPSTAIDALADDIAGTSTHWSIALNMYEEDGTWLRTLACLPYADYAQDGIMVFRSAGIALLGYGAQRKAHEVYGAGRVTRSLRLPGAKPLPRTVSALKAF